MQLIFIYNNRHGKHDFKALRTSHFSVHTEKSPLPSSPALPTSPAPLHPLLSTLSPSLSCLLSPHLCLPSPPSPLLSPTSHTQVDPRHTEEPDSKSKFHRRNFWQGRAFEDYPPGIDSKVAPPAGTPSPCVRLKIMFEATRCAWCMYMCVVCLGVCVWGCGGVHVCVCVVLGGVWGVCVCVCGVWWMWCVCGCVVASFPGVCVWSCGGCGGVMCVEVCACVCVTAIT